MERVHLLVRFNQTKSHQARNKLHYLAQDRRALGTDPRTGSSGFCHLDFLEGPIEAGWSQCRCTNCSCVFIHGMLCYSDHRSPLDGDFIICITKFTQVLHYKGTLCLGRNWLWAMLACCSACSRKNRNLTFKNRHTDNKAGCLGLSRIFSLFLIFCDPIHVSSLFLTCLSPLFPVLGNNII